MKGRASDSPRALDDDFPVEEDRDDPRRFLDESDELLGLGIWFF